VTTAPKADNVRGLIERLRYVRAIGIAPEQAEQTLHECTKKAEVDSGRRAGVQTDTADTLKALEREVRELRQANESLRKASAYFAQGEAAQAMRGMAENRTRA
jgi:transposase-like protein